MKRFFLYLRANSAGFTLLEILTVIVIAGILAAIAAPSWLRYISNQRVGAVQSALLQTLQQAQQEAIKTRQKVVVSVPTTDPMPKLTVGTRTIDLVDGGNIRPNTITLDVAAYTATATPTKDDADTQTLTFDYQGKATVQKGTTAQALPYVITITGRNSSRTRCVVVYTLLGSMKSADGDLCNNPRPLTN